MPLPISAGIPCEAMTRKCLINWNKREKLVSKQA
jgi:hypothetical protein